MQDNIQKLKYTSVEVFTGTFDKWSSEFEPLSGKTQMFSLQPGKDRQALWVETGDN